MTRGSNSAAKLIHHPGPTATPLSLVLNAAWPMGSCRSSPRRPADAARWLCHRGRSRWPLTLGALSGSGRRLPGPPCHSCHWVTVRHWQLEWHLRPSWAGRRGLRASASGVRTINLNRDLNGPIRRASHPARGPRNRPLEAAASCHTPCCCFFTLMGALIVECATVHSSQGIQQAGQALPSATPVPD